MGTKLDFEISVIIPAYNAERTITRALDSVRIQTAIGCVKEVIVINDGSTDNTEEILLLYKTSHHQFPLKIVSKKNGGVSKARNMGMELASGKWIALLDADDEWYEDKLEKQIDCILNNPSIDFLGCNHLDNDIRILTKVIKNLYQPSIKELCIKTFPQTSTVLFKRSIFEEIGGYDESRQYCEDAQFFLKICEKYNYYYCPEKLICFDGGRRGFGVSGLSGNLKAMQEGIRKNNKELLDRKSIDIPFFLFLSIYSEIKYLRRIIICKLEKK